MCKVTEDMRNQAVKDSMMEVAVRLLSGGTLTPEKLAEYVGFPLEKVGKLKTDKCA